MDTGTVDATSYTSTLMSASTHPSQTSYSYALPRPVAHQRYSSSASEDCASFIPSSADDSSSEVFDAQPSGSLGRYSFPAQDSLPTYTDPSPPLAATCLSLSHSSTYTSTYSTNARPPLRADNIPVVPPSHVIYASSHPDSQQLMYQQRDHTNAPLGEEWGIEAGMAGVQVVSPPRPGQHAQQRRQDFSSMTPTLDNIPLDMSTASNHTRYQSYPIPSLSSIPYQATRSGTSIPRSRYSTEPGLSSYVDASMSNQVSPSYSMPQPLGALSDDSQYSISASSQTSHLRSESYNKSYPISSRPSVPGRSPSSLMQVNTPPLQLSSQARPRSVSHVSASINDPNTITTVNSQSPGAHAKNSPDIGYDPSVTYVTTTEPLPAISNPNKKRILHPTRPYAVCSACHVPFARLLLRGEKEAFDVAWEGWWLCSRCIEKETENVQEEVSTSRLHSGLPSNTTTSLAYPSTSFPVRQSDATSSSLSSATPTVASIAVPTTSPSEDLTISSPFDPLDAPGATVFSKHKRARKPKRAEVPGGKASVLASRRKRNRETEDTSAPLTCDVCLKVKGRGGIITMDREAGIEFSVEVSVEYWIKSCARTRLCGRLLMIVGAFIVHLLEL